MAGWEGVRPPGGLLQSPEEGRSQDAGPRLAHRNADPTCSLGARSHSCRAVSWPPSGFTSVGLPGDRNTGTSSHSSLPRHVQCLRGHSTNKMTRVAGTQAASCHWPFRRFSSFAMTPLQSRGSAGSETISFQRTPKGGLPGGRRCTLDVRPTT